MITAGKKRSYDERERASSSGSRGGGDGGRGSWKSRDRSRGDNPYFRDPSTVDKEDRHSSPDSSRHDRDRDREREREWERERDRDRRDRDRDHHHRRDYDHRRPSGDKDRGNRHRDGGRRHHYDHGKDDSSRRDHRRDGSRAGPSRSKQVDDSIEEGEIIQGRDGTDPKHETSASRSDRAVAKSEGKAPPAPVPDDPSATKDLDMDLDDQPKKSIEDILAEKRRKREELMAKLTAEQEGDVAQTLPSGLTSGMSAVVARALTPNGDVSTPSSLGGTVHAAKRLRLGTATPPKGEAAARIERIVEREGSRAITPSGTDSPQVGTPRTPTSTAPFSLAKDVDTTDAPPSGNIDFANLKNHLAPGSPSSMGHKHLEEGHESISAADYNPNDDRLIDDARQLAMEGTARGNVGATAAVAGGGGDLASGTGEPAPADAQKAENVMIVEEEEEADEDDMFAIGTKPKKVKVLQVHGEQAETQGVNKADHVAAGFVPIIDRAGPEAAHLLPDNFDDADGYYKVLLGELLDEGRYHVHANLGKGMFSSVVRAKDTKAAGPIDHEVAIKIVRSQESMFKAGQKEATILRKLAEADPQDKKHLIRLERTFEHRGHLCLVFESLSMNLREVVKRFGKDVGINLRAVRAYAHQMFLALSLLKKCSIMHADIKPDNILVNESKSVLKICDLGSASDTSENEITPYLVSRFYRSPEIMLGLPYDCALDIWSIGCTLYELYTGKILFPGRHNNHMLLLMMELKGKFPHKLLKKAKFCENHFDENLNFVSREINKSNGQEILKKVVIPAKPTHDLRSRLLSQNQTKKMKEDEVKMLANFVDLLDKCLVLDPSRRLTPKDALSHPFMR